VRCSMPSNRKSGEPTARHRHRDFDVEVSINAHGLRDDPHPVARQPGLRRMLLLGDSFAFGYGVPHALGLGERLQARRRDGEVLTAGVSGYGTDQALLWYEQGLHRFQPDVVLLLLHPNDLEDNTDDSRYGYPKPRFVREGDSGLALRNVPVPRKPWMERVERWAYHNTWVLHRLWQLPEVLVEPVFAAVGGDEARTEAAAVSAGPGGDEATEPAATAATSSMSELDLTEALLARLDRRVRADGARLLVVSVPMRPELATALGARIRGLGIPHLDLGPAYDGRPRSEFKFPHDGHWNAEGHRIAADAVDDFLAARKAF